MSRGETGWPSIGTSTEAFAALMDALKDTPSVALTTPKKASPLQPRGFTSAGRLMTLPFTGVFRQLHRGEKPAWTVDFATIVEVDALGNRTKRITGALSAEALREPEFGNFFSFEPSAEGPEGLAPSGILADTLGMFGEYVQVTGLQIADIGPETRDRIVDLAGRLAVKFEAERAPMADCDVWYAQRHPDFYVK